MFQISEFRAAMARSGYTQTKLAKTLGISSVTLWRKLQRDGDFNRSEINTMIDAMQIDDPTPIFFAKELT